MYWTKKKPNKSGFYWYRIGKSDKDLDIVEILKLNVHSSCNRNKILMSSLWSNQIRNINDIDGEWSSEPIPRPESIRGLI